MFRFPWGDMHSLNLGWFLQKFNELREDWATAEAGIDGALDAEIQKAEDALSDVFDARDAAAASATAAAGSASAANTSKTAAQNSATAAASSATLANQKATAAGLSEAAAAQSATAASNSATAAATSATQAGNSASAAQSSAAAAAASDAHVEEIIEDATTEAIASATQTATTAATNAANSATAAASSESNAAGSAATAAGSAAAAASSATAAAGSASDAAASAEAAATAANWHTSLAYPLINNIDKTANVGSLAVTKKGSFFTLSGDRGSNATYLSLTDELVVLTTSNYYPQYFHKVNALSNEGLIIDIKGSAQFTGTLTGVRMQIIVAEYTETPQGGGSSSVATVTISDETFDTSLFLPLANAIGKNCRIVLYLRANTYNITFNVRYGTAPASGLQSIRPVGEIETNETADILPVTRPETETE